MDFLSEIMIFMLADNLAQQRVLMDEIERIRYEYENGLYEDTDDDSDMQDYD